MSKIFEALQFAQTERTHLDKLARQVSTEPMHDPQVLRAAPISVVTREMADRTACDCEQCGHRIRREGIWDFLLGLLGLYPWKCSQCHRRFHRSRRF
jgi:hypothetical protein